MTNYPHWSGNGYQVLRELGHNHLGGRVTYLALQLNTQKPVVIKQFQFAALDASWAEFESVEQEVTMLRGLNHPHIPRYLDSFHTPDGFCMVQSYIQGQSLATPRRWTPKKIKHVALAVLQILVDLQSQTPPIIHRDIKPENILLNEQFNVYLVDFGFARTGGGDVAASSVVKGTMGFMPPEQLFNRQLSTASDLYGLGVTLICLLTGTKSADIGNLMDANYHIHFQHLVPPMQRGWLNWLEKMVAPQVADRYQNAADALAALRPINVNSLPKVRLSGNTLNFAAFQYGEKLTQTISVTNLIPDTVLAGRWEVDPHFRDPPHTPYDHPWISFTPQKFESNQIDCEITVDTSKLCAGATYLRQILLRSNSSPKTHALTLQVQTASLPKLPKLAGLVLLGLSVLFWMPIVLVWLAYVPETPLPWYIAVTLLILLFIWFLAIDVLITAITSGKKINQMNHFLAVTVTVVVSIFLDMFLVALPSLSVIGSEFIREIEWFLPVIVIGIVFFLLTLPRFTIAKEIKSTESLYFLLFLVTVLLSATSIGLLPELVIVFMPTLGVLMFLLVSKLVCAVIWKLVRAIFRHQSQRGFDQKDTAAAILLSGGLGISLASGVIGISTFLSQFGQPYFEQFEQIFVLVVTIAPVAISGYLLRQLIFHQIRLMRILKKYRAAEPHLIKP
ncbi:MAG: serine/threonine-protein kinase [Coleofasciculus sp. A1-SPW-01]|uniref:serine/threonine protein kinase n=1 Tax=Coleofasciculus sp. A1-SPW-01 TaxID=3070819 RepID=UPI0032F41E8A